MIWTGVADGVPVNDDEDEAPDDAPDDEVIIVGDEDPDEWCGWDEWCEWDEWCPPNVCPSRPSPSSPPPNKSPKQGLQNDEKLRENNINAKIMYVGNF